MKALSPLFLAVTLFVFVGCSGHPGGGLAGSGTPGEVTGRSIPGPAPKGSESSASAPVPPYRPKEPYEYRCEIVLTQDTYGDFSKPTEDWYSRSIVFLDNKTFHYSPNELKWAHFYRLAKPGDGTELAPTTATPPYPLEVSLYQRFNYPDRNKVTPTHLFLTLGVEKDGEHERDVSTETTGKLSDESLTVRLEHRLKSATNDTVSLKARVTCVRAK